LIVMSMLMLRREVEKRRVRVMAKSYVDGQLQERFPGIELIRNEIFCGYMYVCNMPNYLLKHLIILILFYLY